MIPLIKIKLQTCGRLWPAILRLRLRKLYSSCPSLQAWILGQNPLRISISGVIEKSEIGQGGSSDFLTGARDIAKGKDRSKEEKYEAKPTPHQSRFFNHERYQPYF